MMNRLKIAIRRIAPVVGYVAGNAARIHAARRQAPLGPKVKKVNFGRDRRYPTTNQWRDGE